MENNESTPKKTKRKINFSRVIPAVLGLVILIVIIIGLIQIIRWNRGEEFIADPNINVDTETEDYVLFMDPSTLPDNNYDGELKILMLGNDTLAYDKGGVNIAELIEKETGATVYNCAFKGSYMAAQHEKMDNLEESALDAFGFFWVSNSIQFKEWTMQEEAMQYLPEHIDKEAYAETIELAKTIDYDDIDLLLIYYDGHDYLATNPINNPEDIFDVTTMEGSFTGCFERYPRNYPNMQCMLIAPTFCYATLEDGTREGCDIADLGHGNLPTCLTTLLTQAQNYSVSYLDNYYGININAETADQYLLEDGITPNEEGRRMIAERISSFINARLIK